MDDRSLSEWKTSGCKAAVMQVEECLCSAIAPGKDDGMNEACT